MIGRAAMIIAAVLTFATAAGAAEWRVDPGKSRLSFAGNQGGAPFEGLFERFQAVIQFDEKDLASSTVSVVIDMTSANTGNAQRDEALRGSDWFAASRYPQGRFEAKSFRHLGGEGYEADAALSIRDVTRPVVLPFTLRQEAGGTRAAGALTIDRTAFGIGQGQWATPQVVAHEVTIRFDLLAVPER
jgi:polyisoprenoid-binding protein YceI